MANKLPLDQSILRFQENEARIDDFANGDAEGGYTSTGGDPVPSIQKFLAAKDVQINEGAASVLAQATGSASAAASSAAAAAASATGAADAATSLVNAHKAALATSTGADLIGLGNSTVGEALRKNADPERYGADPTGALDSTKAFNDALAENDDVFAWSGNYRIDGTVTIDERKTLWLSSNAKLKRFSNFTANADPVVHIKGNYAKLEGGAVESTNSSPGGVVVCGHLNHTSSNYNSLWWQFRNCDVYAKDFGGSGNFPSFNAGIGVYVPSSQPNLGSSFVNYFGTMENICVFNATTSYYLTDLANSHTLKNCRIEFFYEYGFLFAGAYGNTVYGAFMNGAYNPNKVGIYLTGKNYPSAPFASSLNSMYNHFYGSTMELYVTATGVKIDAGNQGNHVQFSWNTPGTAIADADGFNTIIESRQARFTTVRARTTMAVGAATPATTGAGLTFPATQQSSSDPNTFDDYEEGVWTPVIRGTATAGAGTYTIQDGYYTKKGNEVTITCSLNWTAHTGAGNMAIGGLPFVPGNYANAQYVACPEVTRMTLPANTLPRVTAASNVSTIGVYSQLVGTGAFSPLAIDTDAGIYFSMTYRTAT